MQEGQAYHFTTKEVFEAAIKAGKFLEHAHVHNNLYGTSYKAVEAVASSGSTTEALSVNRAFRAIRRSDVVALVIEAMACITEQVYIFC